MSTFDSTALALRDGETLAPAPLAPWERDLMGMPPVGPLTAEETLARAEEARDSLTREVENLRARVEDERSLRFEAERALATFRADVRAMAIDRAQDLGWCRPGLNEALRALGLDPHVTTWQVAVEVTAVQTVYVTVEADSADDAWREADRMDGDDVMGQVYRSGDWQYSGHDSSTSDVEAVDD